MNTSKIKWSSIFIFPGAYAGGLIIIACLISSALLGMQIPRQITELGRSYSESELFYEVIKFLFIIFVFVYINRVIYQLVVNKYVQLLVQHIRHSCFKRWLLNYEVRRTGNNKQDRYPMGEVLSRLINDTEAVRELITSGAFGILIDLFFVISCLISFIAINTTSGIFLSGAQFFAGAVLIWGSKYMRQVFLSVRQSRGNMYREVADAMGGVRETYYCQHESYASRKCVYYFDDFLNKQLKANIWDASYYSIAESLYPILLALVVLIFPYSNITEAAVILAIVDLIQRSIGPIKDIASKVASVQRAVSGFQRVGEFLIDLEVGISSPEDKVERQSLGFEKFSMDLKKFAYENDEDDSFCLKDIQFNGVKGELIGLVGLSGSGKSTLLNIIAGNIIPNPSQLEILLKYTDGRELVYPGESIDNITTYREEVGIVSQESHIFTESLRFNITMGQSRDMSQEFPIFWDQICTQIPYLSKWVPDPELEIRPEELSSGQKQLIAALRTCFLNKTIVLFDEISSGLDSELEAALRKAVLLVQQNSLTIIVAHRIETVISSDKILVMDGGRLVSSGKHQYLVSHCQIYEKFLKEISQSHCGNVE